jgi:hypothetical protein
VQTHRAPVFIACFGYIAAIIRHIRLLQSPFPLSGIPPYPGQCLHIWGGGAFCRYAVYVIPLCHKMYSSLNIWISIFKNIKILELKLSYMLQGVRVCVHFVNKVCIHMLSWPVFSVATFLCGAPQCEFIFYVFVLVVFWRCCGCM